MQEKKSEQEAEAKELQEHGELKHNMTGFILVCLGCLVLYGSANVTLYNPAFDFVCWCGFPLGALVSSRAGPPLAKRGHYARCSSYCIVVDAVICNTSVL